MECESTNVLSDFRHGCPASSGAAFEALFQLHQRAVCLWILRIVRNHSAAEDLTIETFWRIYQSRARFDPSRGFEGWARRIATNVALDYLRSERPAVELKDEVSAPAGADPVITSEIRRKTAEAFKRLPPKLRVAATLAVIEELPHKEIAEALRISVAAVKVRVFRALRLLRNDLARQGIKP
jgi:RNA polymerase sigma-70 factor (ECF subfamily)